MSTCINNKGKGNEEDMWTCNDYKDVIECCFPPCLCDEDDEHKEIEKLREDYTIKCSQEPGECGEFYTDGDGLKCDRGLGKPSRSANIAAFVALSFVIAWLS